ncbi:major capsid protein [Methylovorus menthalis]|uniref:major capsid protein n=1 Tax=Methylovorus menthalis TaxID=1002227 RepID=UPI001E4F8108|nr:major capsid protein [Methylovorus menthalis]MCB4812438.1 major capsid protein [Methylovorus menthalis]
MKKVNLYSRKVAAYLAVGMTLAAAQAQAAIDVSAVTEKIGEGEVAVAAIGGAILVVWAIKKVYSMVRGG